jgi:Flp pilus assembly protein TadG
VNALNHPFFSNQMQFQRGQAMVEYAILFIVLSILFIGGAELGMAALASYKNTDAAKTGINEYAEVNQRRLNILNAERQYSLNLTASLNAESTTCNTLYGKANDEGTLDSTPSAGFKCDNIAPYTIQFASYIEYLDAKIIAAIQTDTTLTPADVLEAYAFRTSEADTDDEYVVLDAYDSDGDDSLTNDELTEAEAIIKEEASSSVKYYKLILLQHLKLAKLPLNYFDYSLREAPIAIGDHASNLIQQPNCNAGIYDDGLPNDRYIYREYYDNTGNRHIFQTGSVVYLFNPLPINTASCQTITAGLSTLVAGYTPPQSSINSVEDFENNFVAGLPKLNQAMYGMYKNDLNGNLIPPGKMCMSDDTNICPDQDLISDEIGPTGYFRWNKGSDSSEVFKYTINNVDADLQNFRPSMQIECNTSPTPDLSSISSCDTSFSKVRLHTRYRKIFEGFLGFGVRAIDVNDDDYEAAVSLFYNPNNGSLNGQVNGVIDSEIGPLGNNGRLSVKQFKDFRGCYEVDVETNQISACN